ncbi:MAG: SusC/RagA family TonB-linked outer membrane protein [Bacteroidia bacterium]|nr:SusC/RagA family TonB-linked outer membrane protein [Bacteroidia bacterium]
MREIVSKNILNTLRQYKFAGGGIKLALLFCLFMLKAQAATSWAQEKRVTLDYSNTAIEQVFQSIEKQTNLYFFFNNSELDVTKKISVSAKNELLSRILEQIVGKDYNYEISNKLIVLEKKENRAKNIQQPAKRTKISGIVKDKAGEPLPGATIFVKNTERGTTTDVNGKFEIEVDLTQGSTLLVSFIGMKNKEINITSGKEVSVVLEEDNKELTEVVVTGIFKKATSAFTGSASKVTAKEIKQYEGRNLVSTLANIDPAFNILPNNDVGFDPNRLPDLQVRGTSSMLGIKELQTGGSQALLNSPLILLDGFEISLQRMMDLDIDEVESVTLLKDGSATALYGSRGANGIIVITTKEPEMGKLKFLYSGNVNVEVPDLSDYHLLNAKDKLELERLSGFYDSNVASLSLQYQEMYARNLAAVERGVNTYWLSQPLRVGVGQRHNLKIEGGDKAFRYAVTAMYNNQAGVMKKSERNTFNGGINLSYKRNDLIFRNNLTIGNSKGTESSYGNFADYAKLNPYWKPYDEKGQLVKFFDTNDSFWGGAKNHPRNPLYDAMLPTINDKSYTSIMNTFSIEWRPSEYFTVRANAGINYQWNESNNFKPRTHTSFETYVGDDVMRKGKYIYGTGKNISYTTRLTASYARLFNHKHNIYLGMSTDLDEMRTNGYSFVIEGFTQENPKSLIMGLQYQKEGKPTGYETIVRRVGTVANFNYSYDNRYFTDISYRVDGSSQFGKNKRFAPFYSVGLGWNLHNENFIKSVPQIDRFTLRGSFGQNGSQQFQAFQAIATYDYYTNDRYHEWMGIYQKVLENTELEWQKTDKYNIGIDADLFKNRVGFTVDMYREKTNNMLSDRSLPWSSGFTSYTENIGSVLNKGFEVRLRGNIIRNTTKGIFLNVTASIASNSSEMLRLSEALKQEYAKEEAKTKKDPSKIIREGESLNTIYAVKSLGIDPSNGMEVFQKRNGEVTYTWNSEDLVACGIGRPKYRGGINTSFRYKNIGLSMAFAYYWGGQIYNHTLVNKIENADKKYNVDERVYNDRWKEVGDYSFFKGITNLTPTYATSRFVQNENVFTCKNIQLSYELRGNKTLKKYAGLESLVLKGDVADLFYWSTVRQERGINYPFSQRFSFGASLIF